MVLETLLDKVDQLKEAAGLMQAKGMIEKDIRSSDNELKELQKQKIRNDLTKKFADLKMVSKIPGQKGYNTAAATASEDYRGNLITQTDLSDMIEKVKDKEGISNLIDSWCQENSLMARRILAAKASSSSYLL